MGANINEEKRKLRKRVKALKASIPTDEKIRRSQEILQRLGESVNFQKAQVVLAYWSMEDEVHTHDFVAKWYNRKTLLLPVVRGDELLLKEFRGSDMMKPGEQYNIPEPMGNEWNAQDAIDLIIVPGVAFDCQKNRMGRGKAYYDKLLRQVNAYKAGVCFQEQYFDEVPHDKHDVRMDGIWVG